MMDELKQPQKPGFPWPTILVTWLLCLALWTLSLVQSLCWGGGLSAKHTRVHGDLAALAGVIDSFHKQTGAVPSQAEGLAILVNPPSGEAKIDEVPLDPWGNEYVYEQSHEATTEYSLFSAGPDGQRDSEDDVYPHTPMPTQAMKWAEKLFMILIPPSILVVIMTAIGCVLSAAVECLRWLLKRRSHKKATPSG